MWKRPWKMVEGFSIGAGLVIVGLLLQFSAGQIAVRSAKPRMLKLRELMSGNSRRRLKRVST